MSTTLEQAQIVSEPVADAAEPEDIERPTKFGRLRWWFEESPIAFTASVAMTLVTIGFLFILTAKALQKDLPMASVALQAVQADSMASDSAKEAQNALEFEQLSASSDEHVLDKLELPELPRNDVEMKPTELLGNQADSDKQMKETEAALQEAGQKLRQILESTQNRGRGTGKAEGNTG